MSLVKEAIQALAQTGELTHDFTLAGKKFVMRPLNSEEQILADGMVDTNHVKKKYGAEKLMTLTDTIQKYRTVAMIALATKSIDGKPPVDTGVNLEEQYKQRCELRDELMSLPSGLMDEIIREYNQMSIKERKFYQGLEENMEK